MSFFFLNQVFIFIFDSKISGILKLAEKPYAARG